MTHFDAAIIGPGSGNSLVTPDFDGKRVAIIESGTFGGTCLNVGCIPTKMYVFAAGVANTSPTRPGTASTPPLAVCAGRTSATASSAGSTWSRRGKDYRVNGPNTTAFPGHATFTGPKSPWIDSGIDVGKEITADQIVIATGAHTTVPLVVNAVGCPPEHNTLQGQRKRDWRRRTAWREWRC